MVDLNKAAEALDKSARDIKAADRRRAALIRARNKRMRRFHSEGMSVALIAACVGISKASVRDICQGCETLQQQQERRERLEVQSEQYLAPLNVLRRQAVDLAEAVESGSLNITEALVQLAGRQRRHKPTTVDESNEASK